MADSTHILLVDDDPAMLRLLGGWLEGEGYSVLQAKDGRAAQELLESARPQILITDWEMPEIDGLELCRWVRGHNFGHYIYTIFLTVRSKSADMLRGLEAGADDFLKKPVDRDELLARIRAGSRVMELEHRLNSLANTDALTGLATRRTIFDRLHREWERSHRYGSPLSCVMMDIDFFKRINDVHGHQAGDDVIRQVGQLLARSVRACDFAGRYGGEEFCILLPETTEAEAQQSAERMRAAIADLRPLADDQALAIAASFGVAERLADTASPEQLIDMADQALVVAKRSGRDRVVAYRTVSQPAAIDHREGDPAKLLAGVPASEVMTSIVAPLNENHTAATAANYFLRFRIPSAPIVDDEGQLVGILSEKDLMVIMLGRNWWTVPIKDVMKRNVVCYEEDTPTLAIFEFLSRVAVRGVVIVNRGSPTGLITRGCLLRFFMNLLAARKIESVFPEVDAAATQLVERMSSAHPRDRIAQTVHSLSAEACDMEWRLTKQDADLIPCVVGGASRMQELVIDLLAISRYIHEADWTDPEAPQQPATDPAQVSGAIPFAIKHTIHDGPPPVSSPVA